jgi:hypothetical protein
MLAIITLRSTGILGFELCEDAPECEKRFSESEWRVPNVTARNKARLSKHPSTVLIAIFNLVK